MQLWSSNQKQMREHLQQIRLVGNRLVTFLGMKGALQKDKRCKDGQRFTKLQQTASKNIQ